jgi:NADH:ubiquinone oxidoreductase subunit 2 (subunit N)
VDDMIAIILLSTLFPAVGAAYILRTNGKTLNFAIIGGTVIYVVSLVTIFVLLYGAKRYNMQGTDLILLLPFVVAGLFYWLLKGSKMGNE